MFYVIFIYFCHCLNGCLENGKEKEKKLSSNKYDDFLKAPPRIALSMFHHHISFYVRT